MRSPYSPYEQEMLDRGLAREFNGRLIPVLRGADPDADPLFDAVPEDFTALDDPALEAFIEASTARFAEITADPTSFVSEARPSADVIAQLTAHRDALKTARAELKSRDAAEELEVDDTEFEAEVAELAALAAEDDTAEEAAADEAAEEADDDTEGDPAGEAKVEPIVAAAVPAVRRAAPPARARRATPKPAAEELVALTAAASAPGFDIGDQIPDVKALAEMMIYRRGQFGVIPDGNRGEKVTIGKFNYGPRYGPERTLGGDVIANQEIIDRVIDEAVMRNELAKRAKGSLTASGGLCAPVTPYYQLAMISVPDRPVRASLPGFNADRGGIRFAAPASLAAVTTGVGTITAAQDAAGGSSATKTCQVVACPAFSEIDVATIFHCLQFGNLGARTFPERVAQWNSLVLAAQARLAESALLTAMTTASTAVTASHLGLGASATLPSQIITAAAGMRSRHRMADDAVLRVMLPMWVKSLLVSDMYRSQFQRFDMTAEDFIAILRANNVEPTFYKDGASGKSQVFGTQAATSLLPFPSTVHWLLFPEGSFLFVDGGTLELGLVRDSVLNSTNDFQLFGETFENVAFIGVESLSIVTTVCDSGAVANPVTAAPCPIVYTGAS